MKGFMAVLFMVLLAGASEAFGQQATQPLYGMVVVIDPGHGGSDPGAHGQFPGGTVYESEYVYDVAVRLRSLVIARGGIAVMTTRDTKRGYRPYDGAPRDVLALGRAHVFQSNNRPVVAGNTGLGQRVALANQTLDRYPRHRVVFVSIHFDATWSSQIEGVHLIAPLSGEIPELVQALETEFRKAGRLRRRNGAEYHPIVRSGDPAHGLRNLYILRSNNRIRQRVLVELGNFANARDVWRIRDYRVRQNYAEAMTRALEQINKPGVRFR